MKKLLQKLFSYHKSHPLYWMQCEHDFDTKVVAVPNKRNPNGTLPFGSNSISVCKKCEGTVFNTRYGSLFVVYPGYTRPSRFVP